MSDVTTERSVSPISAAEWWHGISTPIRAANAGSLTQAAESDSDGSGSAKKKMKRLSIAELKQLVSKPEVVKPTSTEEGPDRQSAAVPVRSSTEGYGEDGDAGPADKPGMDETKPRRGFSAMFTGLATKFVDQLRGALDGGAENKYKAYFQLLELTRGVVTSHGEGVAIGTCTY